MISVIHASPHELYISEYVKILVLLRCKIKATCAWILLAIQIVPAVNLVNDLIIFLPFKMIAY